MNTLLQSSALADNIIDTRRLISGLRQALELNHTHLLDAAKVEWERRYAGKDPSDACVSVRVSSGDGKTSTLACGGILKKPGHSFLNGNRRRLLT